MIKQRSDRLSTVKVAETDPYVDRRAELHQMSAKDRIVAIERDLKKVTKLATSTATFHRKKLLRIYDETRVQAGLVSPAQLQQENSPFSDSDFTKARIVWKPRSIRA